MVRATAGLAVTMATTGTPSTSVTSSAPRERPVSATRITPSQATPMASAVARAT